MMGLAAAAQIGVDLARLAVVPEPPADQWSSVMAALTGAVDMVLACPPRRVRPVEARRLSARARERGTVLVLVGEAAARHWPGSPDLSLAVTQAEWQGLGAGHGHLRSRRVRVEATGRRQAARPRSVELWLVDPEGRVVPVGPSRVLTVLSGRLTPTFAATGAPALERVG
jgi:hypothetical protein